MVYINWEKILTITPENFGEDEKEELSQTLTWYNPTTDINRKQLTALVKVLQEILKYKNEQVESLMSALDELAAKQGEEVARGRQELIDEIEDLREQLEYQKRLERDSGISDDEIRNEVVKLEMQNEELVLELQEREKDLVAEKNESERLIGQVARLEREKLELSRELAAFQEEASERHRHGFDFDSHEGSSDKLEELVETVRQKNKHIMNLLDDIEAAEQENKLLKVKLATTRNELTDANTKVVAFTQELTALRIKFDEASKTISDLQGQNNALKFQVEELVEKKMKNDQVLDEFAIKVNERVEEWKKLIDAKDSEIIKLKDSLNKNKKIDWHEQDDTKENKKFKEQEVELDKLKKEVLKLTKENSLLGSTVDELKKNTSSTSSNDKEQQEVSVLEDHIKVLASRLKIAEEESSQKAEEICQLVRQLRAYENDEFGLCEAVNKIKKLEKKIQDRDSKIENLIAACNKVGIEKEALEDENDYLRDVLEMSPQRNVDPSFIRKRSETNAKTIRTLQEEIEKLQNEIMELKLTNRSLQNKSNEVYDDTIDNSKIQSPKDVSSPPVKGDYNYLIEENDALRKGMHEILESLQKETLGGVEVSSLERLLEALDSRHISGWYHPAMRLQAQLHSVRGECQELRKQIGILRKENVELTCKYEIHDLTPQKEINKTASPQIVPQGKDGASSEIDMAKDIKINELEGIIEQCNWHFERAREEWGNERRRLIKERDSLIANVSNNQFQNSAAASDSTIQLFKFAHIREEALENEIVELRKEFLEKEEIFLEKATILRNEKLCLQKSIRDLRLELRTSVPNVKVIDLESELKDLKTSYNQLLNVKFLDTGNSSQELASIHTESSEIDSLNKEIKALKEKLIISETQLNCCGNNVTPDTFNKELPKLSHKLAAAETELFTEKNRRVLMDKYCETLKETIGKNEANITQLTQNLHEANETNDFLRNALQVTEKELKKSTILQKDDEKTEQLQIKYEILLTEKNKVDGLLETCRKHLKSIETSKENKEIELQLISECINFLQNEGSEKMVITKLTHDLIAQKKLNEETNRLNSNLKMSVSSLLSEIIEKDDKISQLRDEISMKNEKHIQHLNILFAMLTGIQQASKNAVCFPSISRAKRLIAELDERNNLLSKLTTANEAREKDLSVKEYEMQIELDALHNLKSAFQSDSKELVSWHNKSTELRLREARYMIKSQFLTDQLERLDALLKRYKEEITNLDEKALEREKYWEEKMQEWLISQKSLLDIVENKNNKSLLPDFSMNIAATKSENEISQLNEVISKLKEEMAQKEAVFKEKLTEQIKICRLQHSDKTVVTKNGELQEIGSETEKKALIETTSNLQSIINKKEVTVIRYQELLKKTREEHGDAIRRLQNELRNVHNVLANQSKAYSRLKHGGYQPSSQDIEKYLNKIQELEEEGTELQGNLARVQSELKSCEQEVERWMKIAEEREYHAEEIKERMELEMERCREEIHNYQIEIQQLKEFTDGGQTKMLIDTITGLQKKLAQYGNHFPSSPVKKPEKETADVPVEQLTRQLRASQEECSRLRDQLKSLRALKSRPSSSQSRGNNENLVEKVRKLEESLHLSKQHEKELEDIESKRLRSVEQVARWDERKRYEKTVERLQNKLKQKDVEITVALSKLETMRGLLARSEKENGTLQGHVRNLTDSARENLKMEKIVLEKAELSTQVADLQEELTRLKLKEDGKEIGELQIKLKKQEELIRELRIAGKETGKHPNISLAAEKELRRLQNENWSLNVSIEKLKEQNKQLKESQFRLEAELKLIKAQRQSSSKVRTSYDLQREVSKLKIDLKSVQEKLSITTFRNTELEEEIHQLRSQIHLWEEKDVADTLARTNQQRLASDLNQELIDVKSQLAHKVHLLDRVKILLSKAAAKEKALNDKVVALQSLVPTTSRN